MQLSIALPVHNGEPFIEEALVSLLQQSFSDFEILVIDDGSTDRTPEILSFFAKRDPRIKIFRNLRPYGICQALNQAISCAQGELIARMDADDVAHPKRLEKQLKCFQSDPELVLLGTDIELIDGQGKVIGERRYPQSHEEIMAAMKDYSPFCHPTVMFKKTAILKAGGYREDFRYAEDYDLWFRMRHLGKMANLPELLLKYRIHSGQVTVSKLKNQHRFHMAARKEHLGLGDYSLWHRIRGKKGSLGSKYMTLTYQQQQLGNSQAAIQLSLHALRHSPLSSHPWRFLWGHIRRTSAYDRCLWYFYKLSTFLGR